MAAPLLRMTGITKGFPGVQALDSVTFEVKAGEVHALLGENGAGKSTLLKILAGAETPDAGEIILDGRTRHFNGPHDAQNDGIVTIHQEFNLIPTLSVAENLFVGQEPVRFGLVDWRRMNQEAAARLLQLGLNVDPRRLVADLSVAEQQLVEIVRALSTDSRLIVMDEPTSALSEQDAQRLFGIIRDLKAKNIAIIFVTHRLEEVIQICDTVTVLRDGRLVGRAGIEELTIESIIKMMVGREMSRLFARRNGLPKQDVALAIANLNSQGDPRDPHATRLKAVSLNLRQGEILGLAGLVGAGRTELARAIFGADPVTAGQILVNGRPVVIRSPKDAIAAGIGLVPEDRKLQALFLSLAVRINLSIAALERLPSRLGMFDGRSEQRLIDTYRQRLNIRMAGADQPVAHLSGGNQQKVVLARWLALEPKILIVDEPTRGIDVAAKAEVHQLLYELAASGIGILAISSELPEIMAISDRIITMREGRVTGEIAAVEATEEKLMTLMTLREAA